MSATATEEKTRSLTTTDPSNQEVPEVIKVRSTTTREEANGDRLSRKSSAKFRRET